MPNRLASRARAIVYGLLAQRDGELCQQCAATPLNLRHPLEIDHVDGTFTNWTPTNLRLLCKPCNVAAGNRQRVSTARLRTSTPETVQAELSPSAQAAQRERENPISRLVKDAVDYQAGSPEMRAADHFETRYRAWLIETVAERGHLPKRDAITAGAEVVGCNTQTASRYLEKLTSFAGPLETIQDMLRTWVIVLRAPTAPPMLNPLPPPDPQEPPAP